MAVACRIMATPSLVRPARHASIPWFRIAVACCTCGAGAVICSRRAGTSAGKVRPKFLAALKHAAGRRPPSGRFPVAKGVLVTSKAGAECACDGPPKVGTALAFSTADRRRERLRCAQALRQSAQRPASALGHGAPGRADRGLGRVVVEPQLTYLEEGGTPVARHQREALACEGGEALATAALLGARRQGGQGALQQLQRPRQRPG